MKTYWLEGKEEDGEADAQQHPLEVSTQTGRRLPEAGGGGGGGESSSSSSSSSSSTSNIDKPDLIQDIRKIKQQHQQQQQQQQHMDVFVNACREEKMGKEKEMAAAAAAAATEN